VARLERGRDREVVDGVAADVRQVREDEVEGRSSAGTRSAS
jgi:hypothetical protein